MRRPARPMPTRSLVAFSLTACVIVLLLMTTSCARPALSVPGAPPRLEFPTKALTPCVVSAGAVVTLADLEARDRARGADVKECDDARRLAVETKQRQDAAEDAWLRERAARNSRGCRWFGVGCS